MPGLVVDLFAGGGGASLGMARALGRDPDIAINHDPEAVAMHRANHPGTKHYCQDVFTIKPLDATGGRPVDLLWASPDCKHFSKAKGGKPRSRKIRDLAWVVVRWARDVKPRVIILENVEEFRTWGPLGPDNRPDKARAGQTFNRWVAALRRLGYQVEWRELVACDYGAPTSRKRFFLVARRDGRAIVWPEPTHGPEGSGLLPWRTAAECIDWSIPCPSIFERKRPLAENTLRRIAKGLQRFVIEAADPFIVTYYGPKGDDFWGQDLGQPLKTLTAENRHALVEPFLLPIEHYNGRDTVHSLAEPMRTLTAHQKGGQFALVAPTLIQSGYGERRGQAPRAPGLNKPLGTVVAGGVKHALVSAFLAKHYRGVVGRETEKPLSTITTRDHHSLVTSHLVKLKGTNVGQDTREPLQTITAGGLHFGEVRAFLTKYYGQGCGQDLGEPAHTVTAKDRMGLVTVAVEGEPYVIADIGLRMLQPRELFTAQGFPADYIIDRGPGAKRMTKTAQVRLCGNSVPPPWAEALTRANCGHVAEEEAA